MIKEINIGLRTTAELLTMRAEVKEGLTPDQISKRREREMRDRLRFIF